MIRLFFIGGIGMQEMLLIALIILLFSVAGRFRN